MPAGSRSVVCLCMVSACAAGQPGKIASLPPNQWTSVAEDASGARRGSAIRYAAKAHAFFLWGFMNDNPDLEGRLMKIPEYDTVFFDPAAGRWQNHLPRE